MLWFTSCGSCRTCFKVGLKPKNHKIDFAIYILTHVYLYKLLNNLVDSPDLLKRFQFNIPRIAPRADKVFHIPTPNDVIDVN